MKLAPAAAWLQTTGRPLLNSRVAVVDPNHPDQEWGFYLRLRLDAYDLVTTTALIPPAVIITTLVVRDAGTVLRYSVRLEPLSAPIAMWRILYQGEPEQQDLRQEQRNDADTFNGWTHHPDRELEEWLPTTSYDFSLRAIRFFAPWRLSPDTVVPVRWQLDNDRIEGTLRVVRQDKAAVWWQKQQGYQTVGQWESLTDPMRYRWRVYCWRHQPTSSHPLGG